MNNVIFSCPRFYWDELSIFCCNLRRANCTGTVRSSYISYSLPIFILRSKIYSARKKCNISFVTLNLHAFRIYNVISRSTVFNSTLYAVSFYRLYKDRLFDQYFLIDNFLNTLRSKCLLFQLKYGRDFFNVFYIITFKSWIMSHCCNF